MKVTGKDGKTYDLEEIKKLRSRNNTTKLAVHVTDENENEQTGSVRLNKTSKKIKLNNDSYIKKY